MRQEWWTWTLHAVRAAALLVAMTGPAGAAAVTVVPADTSVTVGDTLTVRIESDAIADLKGCELIYAYTSSRLEFVGAEAGAVLAGGGYFDYVLPDAAAPADSVWYDAARLVGTAAGPGVVALFTFVATAEGDASLACLLADLRDSNNAPLNPSCAGGVIHVLGPVPARAASWGRIKSLYR
jgi:hypothetical protein